MLSCFLDTDFLKNCAFMYEDFFFKDEEWPIFQGGTDLSV